MPFIVIGIEADFSVDFFGLLSQVYDVTGIS